MPTRRRILGIAAGLAVWPRLALAAAPGQRRLVLVILRGGLDGLAAVPPYADPAYATLRGGLTIADRDTLDLDGRFGLHPALAPLHKLYRAGEMSVLHATATPYRARSHFDAQDVLENGAAAAADARDGWLNRALALYGAPDRRFGLAAGQGVPLVLRGETPVASWAPQRLPQADAWLLRQLVQLYATDPVLAPALDDALAARRLTAAVLGDQPAPGRGGDVAALVAAVGRLLADRRGPRVAVFEVGGWDTHARQGAATGQLASRLGALAAALTTLRRSLGPTWDETAVLVATEFGRTAQANGTGGTDHGTAGVAFLLGGRVAGGRVLADWPGLAAGRLYQGRDLAPTTDLRTLFAAALVDHLGLPAGDVASRVFPSLRPPPLRDLFRS